jgi:PAS domain S-box-containing protein
VASMLLFPHRESGPLGLKMDDRESSNDRDEIFISDQGNGLIRASIGVLIVAIFVLDSSMELGVAVGMLYVIPIILSTLLKKERLPVILGGICTVLTITSAFIKPVNFTQAYNVVLPNRLMMLIIIWATTIVSVFLIRRGLALKDARDNLQAKVNERTAALSDSVIRLEDEVAERTAIEEELRQTQEELEMRVEERTRELANEKERLFTTLKSIGDAVIATDTDERITIMNRVAEIMTGWKFEEASGRPLDEVFNIVNERTREQVESPVKQVFRSGSIVDLANHTVLISRDGTEQAIGDSGAPVIDAEGRVTGAVLVFRDMSKELKSIEELERAQRLESLGILAGGIAHDFNNVLTALEGYIEIAKIRAGGNKDVVDKLTDAEKVSVRARHLTHQLLTFARGGEPVKRTISVRELLKDNARFALSGSSVRCTFLIADDLWDVNADEGQIAQVVHNLVLNAKEAMPQGGTIEVRAENAIYTPPHSVALSSGRYVKIQVKDEGVGIPPNYSKKIFDPYFSTKQDGRGLGLTIIFSIIDKHDGFINVDSKVGLGTTFTIYLPVAEMGEKRPASMSRDGSKQGLRSALWMDDEGAILEIGSEFLAMAGFQTKTARDGREAADHFRHNKEAGRSTDVVLLDLIVPGGIGGKEALVLLKSIDPHFKAIVCSGYYSDPVMANFKDYGFDGVLQKPFTMGELNKVLEDVLKGRP